MALKTKMSLDGFLEAANSNPNLLYNAHQRMYAAILRYGKTGDRWNFTAKQENDDRNLRKTLYGLTDVVDEFVSIVKRGAQNPDIRNKAIVFIGQAGTGKSELLKTIDETLKAYSKTEQGTQYVLKLHLDRFMDEDFLKLFGNKTVQQGFDSMLGDMFGDVNTIRLGLGLNVQTALYMFLRREDNPRHKTKIEDLISKLKKNTDEYWKMPTLYKEARSSQLEFVKDKLVRALSRALFKDDEPDMDKIYGILEKAISIEKATGEDLITMTEPVAAAAEKNLDYQAIFGGKFYYKMLNSLHGDNANPLAYDFGVLGSQSAPSPTGGAIYFSEILKGSESFAKSILDVIQDSRNKVSPAFYESFDSIVLGTTNMTEFRATSENMKPFLIRRTHLLTLGSMSRISDAKEALNDIYSKAAKELDVHYSPHFVKMLARIWVEAGLEEFKNVSLKDKADLYDGKKIFDHDVQVSLEDMKRQALEKPLGERIEGVQLAIPYDDMIKSPGLLMKYAKTAEGGAKNNVCLDSILSKGTRYLEDFLNTVEDVSDVTKGRIRSNSDGSASKILQDAYGEIKKSMEDDVLEILWGSERIQEYLDKYVLNVYFMTMGQKRIQMNGKSEPVEEDFVTEVEKKSGINPNSVRESIKKWISSGFEVYNRQLDEDLIRTVSKNIREDYKPIVNGITKIINPEGRPGTKSDEETVIKGLLNLGYCDKCARVAYHMNNDKK